MCGSAGAVISLCSAGSWRPIERMPARLIANSLAWLSHRQDRRRPFFAFLNYYDAHSPYLPPEGTRFRFGSGPRTVTDFMVLVEDWKTLDKLRLGQYFIDLIQDSYENCLAYLDWRLGELFDELQRRGLLDRTVVIITADHGEELGDHGLFEHGESLYRPEIQVPLLVLLPSGGHSASVVRETVSLRDLPATIVDLAGLAAGAPFPGRSLARLWSDSLPGAGALDPDGAISELPEPNPTNPSRGRSPAAQGPLDLPGPGGLCLHPQREGWARAVVLRARRSSRVVQSAPRTKRCSPSSSASASVSTR